MKVLIYGSTGFVGRYVVRQLIGKVELFLAARNESKAKSIFGDSVKAVKFNDKIENPIFEVNPDVVINLIGILKESGNNTFEYTHYEIPKRLIDASKNLNAKKFIQMSALGADINSKVCIKNQSNGRGVLNIQWS